MSTENEPLLIRYQSVNTLLFSVRQLSENQSDISALGFQIQTSVRAIVPDLGEMPIIIDVVLTEPNITEPLARLLVLHNFHIQGIERLERDGKYHVPKSLVTELVTASYMTTRGVLLARGAGTVVESLVLPMIDPKEIMQRFTETEEGNIVIEPEGATA